MKNNKGITLISLLITVAVMVIISGVSINISRDRFKINSLKKMYNDIELLSNKVENYYLKYGGLPILKSNNNFIKYTYSELNFDRDANDNNNYYIIDFAVVGNITLNYGKNGYENPNTTDDVYIINEQTHKIYYVKGIEASDGTIIHSLNFDTISSSENQIGPTKPEINVLSNNNNTIEIEIIPGKDASSGISKTEYNIKSTDIENNVTQTQNTEISDRTVVGNLSGDKAHEITATTTSNNGITSQKIYKINEWIDKLDIGDYVNYENSLSDVSVTDNSPIIQELTTYSGNRIASYNKSDKILQEKNLRWRVLDVKGGKLRLISEKPTTISKIRLYSDDGYNNAVYLLDKVCDMFYSSSKGNAKNLKVEDIEEHLTYDYTQYSNQYTNTGKYGGSKEYNVNLQYPNIYSSTRGCLAISSSDNTNNSLGVSEQTSPILGNSVASDRLKVTQTFWYRNSIESDFYNSKYYMLYFCDEENYPTYWLSSRNESCESDKALFSIYRIYNCHVGRYLMYSSDDTSDGFEYAYRPVVTLNSNNPIGEKVNSVWQIN